MGPRQGRRCFGAPWAWRIGGQSQSMPNVWRSLDAMDEQEGGAGLIFSLRFDPMRAGFDRALVSFPASALISRLLGWGKNSGSQGRPQGSVMVAAAAVALYVAALFVSDQQPRRRRLAAARPASAATKPRALPAPDDGLRILSSNDEYLENVIHGASIGAGDDEPVVVARVQTMPPGVAGATETEHDQPEKEEEDEEVKRFKELWLSLVEREQRLELREMDLDGLREHQEAAVKELENRVGVAAVEARLLELKVLSLREENEQLKAQAAELEAVRVQLGRAKEKLWALTERVQAEREEARSEAAALRDKVTELEKAMAGLEEENGELARRLQDAEQVSSAVISMVHEDNVVDEAHRLREAEREDDDHELPLSDKAKELMLHYGSLGLYGYDPVMFSPLNESLYGDGGNHHRRVGDHDEPWRSPVMPSPSAAAPENRAGHGKHKFLRNIKKLLASSRKSHDRKSKKAATDDELGKAMRSLWLSSGSHDALGGDSSCESTPLSSCERTPLRSVTAVDLHARRARGGEAAAASEAPSAPRPEAGAQLARSKSDLGASVRREATRYHALRPESPAVVGTYGGYHSPEKIRTYSDELRSS